MMVWGGVFCILAIWCVEPLHWPYDVVCHAWVLLDPVPHLWFFAVPCCSTSKLVVLQQMCESGFYIDFAWRLSNWGSLKPWT